MRELIHPGRWANKMIKVGQIRLTESRRNQLGKLTGPLTRLFEAFLKDEEDCAELTLTAGTLIPFHPQIVCNHPA